MGTCERRLELGVSADVAWEWMCDPQNIFSTNIFHAEVEWEGGELERGSVVPIFHDMFGVYKVRRQAKVREFRKYFIAWGEHNVPGEPGKDSFPHTQSFEVVPLGDDRCEIVNTISGRYVFPGSKLIGEAIFRRYMPHILDDDNRVLAVGCGALESNDVKTPKGLLLWPLWNAAARFTKKSTRRDILAAKRTLEARGDSKNPEPAK